MRGKVVFEPEKGKDVVLEQLGVVEQLLGPPDLLGLILFLEVALGQLERRCANVPVLEDSNAGLLGLEELRHQSKLRIKAITD